MKILICGYRTWALNTLFNLQIEMPQHQFTCVRNDEALLGVGDGWDIIALVGWSWKVPAHILASSLVIGIHPSDLPAYAGGSPLQHQIIDGLVTSVATLFRLSENFDAGDIMAKEPFSLDGHITDVFSSLELASVKLLKDAINRHPNHTYIPQMKGLVRRRLKPENSLVTNIQLRTMTCRQIYDFIRCREDPYPNVHIEDETGRLVFKRVEFEPKENS